MKRVAFFVEGMTEQLFVRQLVEEAAGKKNVVFELHKSTGKRGKRLIELESRKSPDGGEQYYVLITDCGSDTSVASDVRDNYERLVATGYDVIVGLRDVYPDFAAEDIPELRRNLGYKIKTKPTKVDFVLAVMEVECWFVAEYTHFAKVNTGLTEDVVCRALGFNPRTDDVEQRSNPANDLHNAYHEVGLAYRKHRNQVQRTIDHLDYASLFAEMPARVPSLKELVTVIDKFLTPAMRGDAVSHSPKPGD